MGHGFHGYVSHNQMVKFPECPNHQPKPPHKLMLTLWTTKKVWWPPQCGEIFEKSMTLLWSPYQLSSRVFQDLSGDGGVLKRCLRTGTGSTLPEGGARTPLGGKKTGLILVKPTISWGFIGISWEFYWDLMRFNVDLTSINLVKWWYNDNGYIMGIIAIIWLQPNTSMRFFHEHHVGHGYVFLRHGVILMAFSCGPETTCRRRKWLRCASHGAWPSDLVVITQKGQQTSMVSQEKPIKVHDFLGNHLHSWWILDMKYWWLVDLFYVLGMVWLGISKVRLWLSIEFPKWRLQVFLVLICGLKPTWHILRFEENEHLKYHQSNVGFVDFRELRSPPWLRK